MIEPYYEQDGITIYHGDCREVLPQIEPVDLVLTDPPYGMKWNTDCKRFRGGRKGGPGGRNWGQGIEGDSVPFDPSPWLSFPRVILWGFNHFAQRLPVGTTLVWVKRNEEAYGSFLSDAELAWMKGGHGVYLFKDLSMAGIAKSRVHPAQKPVGLMRWCIERMNLSDEATILDPFMGSGSTLRAAKDLGQRAIGIEISEAYCEVAANRLAQGVLQFAES